MDYEKSPNKSKIIVACAIIAAVAILYFISAARTSSAQTAAAISSTGASASSQDTSSMGAGMGSSGMSSGNSSSSSSAAYKDGTYTASESYMVPHSHEAMSVTLTVRDGVITNSSLNQSEDNPESAQYQQVFADSYQQYVVGKKLSDISLSRVSGASLTTEAFNIALDQIKTKAGA